LIFVLSKGAPNNYIKKLFYPMHLCPTYKTLSKYAIFLRPWIYLNNSPTKRNCQDNVLVCITIILNKQTQVMPYSITLVLGKNKVKKDFKLDLSPSTTSIVSFYFKLGLVGSQIPVKKVSYRDKRSSDANLVNVREK